MARLLKMLPFRFVTASLVEVFGPVWYRLSAHCALRVPCWRDGRVAEGNGLLNRHTVKSGIGGSNPPLSDSSFTNLALPRFVRQAGGPAPVSVRVYFPLSDSSFTNLALPRFVRQAGGPTRYGAVHEPNLDRIRLILIRTIHLP